MQKISVPIREHQLLQLFIIALHKLGGTLNITELDLLKYHQREFDISMFQQAEPDEDGYLAAKDGGEVTVRLREIEVPAVIQGPPTLH